MTDARFEAQAWLWTWAGIGADDASYADGLAAAAEHSALFSADEIVQWRRVLAGEPPPAAPGSGAAAHRHLERLLDDVRPLSRNPRPEAVRAGRRFDAALTALHRAGVLGDDVEAEWRARRLAVATPWLEDEERLQLLAATGIHAVAIPPATAEEEAADAAPVEELEVLARRGHVRTVHVPERVERHDGLAVVAVVTRTESTEVLFHHVGGEQGTDHGLAALDAFEAALDALVPPALHDDQGTRYEPVAPRPVGGGGTAGTPDPERPRVITGTWRYQPPAPDAAATFEVHAAGLSSTCRARET
ncbi:hypothetical protein DVA67_017280 [Solirubrobacter sp. CPCC 204708]|uniref:YcaO domain-containing protein n=1 Tax=Solirubrobacter deserti TaxID=2282478 RepID=A0ABT4RD64_9ACTN|nr:hypothetical protein [Solirubrobacter deserti]MBE2317738.1 hypothetical protein [Solirubrobacter deserti]MDA0136485.1 hypothetical protein [Solirubrobacter deserti]